VRLFGKLLLIGMVLGGGYTLYRQPPIQDLIKPAAKTDDPLKFLEREVPVNPRVRREESSASEAAKLAPGGQNPDERKKRQDSDPVSGPSNQEISRVLLGVLRAKGLGRGISIAVSDTEVIIGGLADSAGEREQMIRIVEKGRGHRNIDASSLRVHPRPES
jgi:hypothetical protein